MEQMRGRRKGVVMMICLVRVLYAELWGNKRPMLKCKDCPCKCKEGSE